MEPIKFPGSKIIGKPESMTHEQCNAIHALFGVDDDRFSFFLECWKPSTEDIALINAGMPVWLKIIANGLPPVAMYVEDQQGNSNGTFNLLRDAVKTLCGQLAEDESLFIAWKSNIAMALFDQYNSQFPNSRKPIHDMANVAAHKFLNLLIERKEIFDVSIPNTKHSSACLAKAKDDEPIFVLRANDPFAPEIVREWALRVKGVQPEDKIAGAMNVAQQMSEWFLGQNHQ